MKKNSSKRNSNTTTVGEAIEDLLKVYHLENKFDQKSLVQSWPKLMGATIANRTGKIYFKNKVLFVEITSPPLKTELNMSKSKVMKILQESAGQGLIEEIIFV